MTAAKIRGIEPHKAEGIPVITVIGDDGLRWACAICNETVFEKDGKYFHFDKSLNPQEA